MASEIRVDKITSLSGVGTITPSSSGIDITGITTVATLKATTGIVTTLTAVSSAKVGSGVTLSPDGDIFATGVTTSTTFVGNLTGDVTGTASGNAVLTGSTNNQVTTVTGANAITGESGLIFDGTALGIGLAPSSDTGYILQLGSGGSQTYMTFATSGSGEGATNGLVIGNDTSRAYITQRENQNINIATNNIDHMILESDGDLRLSSDNANNNYGFIDGWVASTGDMVIGADQSATGTSGSNLIFRTRGSERARIINSGGITFNGDTAAANALDDYEEGSFTPKLGGTSNSSTYNVEGTGTYIKIGRKVTVSIRFNLVDLDNNASGTAKIFNMPFTSGHAPTNGTAGVTGDAQYYNVPFSTDHISNWYINTGTTAWVGLISRSNTSWDNWPISDFHAGTLYINFAGTYFTA